MKRGIRYDKFRSVSWSEVEDANKDECGDRVGSKSRGIRVQVYKGQYYYSIHVGARSVSKHLYTEEGIYRESSRNSVQTVV
jgi:hypothetical protein